MSTQLSGSFQFDPVSIDVRGSYSKSAREAPYELTMGYARTNAAADPYGAYFTNRLSGQNRNYANIAFSHLEENLLSAGGGLTWRLRPSIALSAGYDFTDTERDSTRREFQIRAPSTFPSGVALLRPDLLLGSDVIDYYDIGLVETTETDPAFTAKLHTHAGYLQAQVELLEGLELSAGAAVRAGRAGCAPGAGVHDTVQFGCFDASRKRLRAAGRHAHMEVPWRHAAAFQRISNHRASAVPGTDVPEILRP